MFHKFSNKLTIIFVSTLLVGIFCPVINSPAQAATCMTARLSGRIVLQVESAGEAWYVSPRDGKTYSLGRPPETMRVVEKIGLGITDANLGKIPRADSNDVERDNFAHRFRGQILLQVQSRGEAWYVNPTDLKRYYLGSPQRAFDTLRQTGLGIYNRDWEQLDRVMLKTNDEIRAEILGYTNSARADSGRHTVQLNTKLNEAAHQHAMDMVRRGYFSHTSPDGKNVGDRARAAGFDWHSGAENIAYGQPTTYDVIQAWLGSPGHRENLLNAGYRQLGVGFATNSSGQIYWVMVLAP